MACDEYLAERVDRILKRLNVSFGAIFLVLALFVTWLSHRPVKHQVV